MKIKYRVCLQTSSFSTEYFLAEGKKLKIGTTMDCEIILPTQEKNTCAFALLAEADQVSAACSGGYMLHTKQVQTKLLLPARLAVLEEETNKPIATVTVELFFEKEVPDYTYSCVLPQGQWISIGGASSCHVRIQNHIMREDYISLQRDGTKANLMVKSARYGVYVNGERVTDFCELGEYAFISINGYEFYYRQGSLYMDRHIQLKYPADWKRIENNLSSNNLEYPKFNKSPRFVEELNEEPIEILDPPAKKEKPKGDLAVRLLPTLVMLVVTVLSRSFLGGGGSFYIFSAISMSAGVLTSVFSFFKSKKDVEKENIEREEKYDDYIKRKKTQIEEAQKEERELLKRIYRTPHEGIDALWKFSEDLYDRSPKDSDFLQVYLGVGMREACRPVTFNKREAIEISDELMQMPEILSEKYKYIEDVPITSDFLHSNAIGVVGPKDRIRNMLSNMTFDLALRHLPRDLQLYYVVDADVSKWLRWLPHVQNYALGVRNIVCDDESKTALLEHLYALLAQRETSKTTQPHCVVFAQNDEQIKTHPLAKYFGRCASLGVTFVFMESHREFLPENCDEVVTLEANMTVGTLERREDASNCFTFSYGIISEETEEQAALRLAPVYCEETSVENALPSSYSFFDCFGIWATNCLELEKRWAKADVSKSLAVPIGVDHKGEHVLLDIHEKAHGPHGLVAGTTGSGKSEFLQSYLGAMSMYYSPYDVAFLIIDFKGGGMAEQLKGLPHMVGTITNIDGNEIARSLKSIRAEQEKRQRLFKQAEVNHIDKYIRLFKERKVSTPLPHLIIVVDEFAELKAAQPDFMNELISAARVGRSLGIYLILATQKPAGQVNDQIWSNSRFRLCFKVQNSEDSNEMLHSPLAAEIKEAGRGYLQVGNNEVFTLFQSAYSGGSVMNEAKKNTEDFTLAEVSMWGERKVIYNSARTEKAEEKTDTPSQLKAVIAEIGSYFEKTNMEPLSGICLSPLPQKLPYPVDSRRQMTPGICVCMGRYDDPENQKQADVDFDLTAGNLMIIGSAQTGKTNALQTIIRSLAERYTADQVHIYALDFGSQVLKNFEDLPHVGGVALASEEEKVNNLFKLLLNEMEKRKEKLMMCGISSYASYLEAEKTDLAQIIVAIENFTALRELYEAGSEALLKICREGTTVGISVVIANGHTTGLGYKYLANFAHRVAFFCHDTGEYSSLFDHCRVSPTYAAGRGLVKLDNRILEFQNYLCFAGEKEIERVHEIRAFAENIMASEIGKRAPKIPVVPEILPYSKTKQEYPEAFAVPYNLPVGMNYATMRFESIDLLKVGAVGICGREGMGRTNMLKCMLRTMQDNLVRDPVEVQIVDDLQMRLKTLGELSCVSNYTILEEEIVAMVEQLHQELLSRKLKAQQSGKNAQEVIKQFPLQVLVLAGQDAVKAVAAKSVVQDKLMEIIKELYVYKACVIVSYIENAQVSYSGPVVLKYLKDEKKTFIFEDVKNFRFYETSLRDERAFEKAVRPGDAYGYVDGTLRKVRTIYVEEIAYG